MKIQYISFKKEEIKSCNVVTYSTLNAPLSLDSFDVNIFSLQDENIWLYEGTSTQCLNCSNDLESIQKMLRFSAKALNIILLPQNYMHKYYRIPGHELKYYNKIQLKDEIVNLTNNLLSKMIPNVRYELFYENSKTEIEGSLFDSAFCFLSGGEILTESKGSNKVTTVKYDTLILTTLNIKSDGCKLDDFLKSIGLSDKTVEFPSWVYEYACFDDTQQRSMIVESKKAIDDLNDRIHESEKKLAQNLHYKSILSTNGNELVAVVFEILEKILSCDLSEFVDEGKQDFLIKKETVTFIGEIKGITSNVKSENVSQLDVHYQSYLEDLREKKIDENVKSLLIINPFRTKPIEERDEVHEIQINLAKRNGSLIITTETLLKIFEKFLNNDIAVEKVVSIFSSETGLVDIKSFE